MILAGDVGGTKTRLALFKKGKFFHLVKEESYRSKEYGDFFEIIQKFLKPTDKVTICCFGIAGPVRKNRVEATNLPWVIDAEDLSSKLNKAKIYLINDLEANAWGIETLNEDEFYVINEGDVSQSGNRALISAGTGLGEAGLFFNGKLHLPFASEGGHASFSPSSEREVRLLKYLQKKFSHVSWERVVSGMGIENIFQFLVSVEGIKTSKETLEKINQSNTPAKIISEIATEGKEESCLETMLWFLSLYGAEAGNLGLKILSLGGVFIGGGIAPKILNLFEGKNKNIPTFFESFINKGRMKGVLQSIPIKVILNEKTALLGAAEYAFIREFGEKL